jgi:hypothetical protein
MDLTPFSRTEFISPHSPLPPPTDNCSRVATTGRMPVKYTLAKQGGSFEKGDWLAALAK